MLLLRKMLWVLALISICSGANAEMFVVKNIHVNGLQRISLGTVLSNLHDIVKKGDKIDTSETSNIIHALYETKFFSDVAVKRNNDDLIINVVERSVIGSMNISGNSKITKKHLIDALKNVGVAEGQPLDPAVLYAIKRAIINEYYNLGLYDSKVSIDVKPEVRNRSAVTIKIHEGPTAKIKSIKIVGNKAFKEKTILKEFSLSTTKLWSFFTHSDQYSQEKLDADLEKLRSYYMDRGYLHIKVDGTKVTITPDKKGIYIVISITEGSVYRLSGIDVDGDLIGKRSEILKLVTLKPGKIFSRKEIHEVQNKIQLFLGDRGYGMAEVGFAEPDFDEINKRVRIKFIVKPGHLVYIRHVDFTGNHKTNDDVLRREMRFQEGSLFSLSKINDSGRRLANLGYLQDIDHKISKVPDSNNQVDVVYEVKETSAITANIQGGYSDRDGFIYGAGLSDTNFLGAGKTASISFNNTKATQSYGIGYRDPYFTADKIGFSINAYIQKANPNKIKSELSGYRNSTYGGLFSFDMPLSDNTQVALGFGIEHITIHRGNNTNNEIDDFLNANGTSFNQFKVVSSWSYSYFDRAIFPTDGFGHSIAGELYGPLNRHSLEFYKLEYNANWYRPLFMGFIFHARGDLGYGDGFGRTKKLFFMKNFYAGGIGSVRGFEADTLSDLQKDADKVMGGNVLTLASASIIIPNPMKDMIRPSVFVDVGNVYENRFKFENLRASYGVQLEWMTPLNVPLIFSLGWPIPGCKKSWDHTTPFQFSLGLSI